MDEPAPEIAPEVESSTPAPDDPLRPYRSWATVLFTILAITGSVGLAVVVASVSSADGIVLVTAAATVLLAIGVFGATALGLDRRAAWAIHAVLPLCVVLIVSGLLRSGIALTTGRIDIPIEVIGALLVLTRDHRPEWLPAIDRGGRRTMVAVVALAIVAQLLPVLGEPLRRGDVFGAPESALALSVDVACDAPATFDTPATARLTWSWDSGEPFPPDVDGVRFEWSQEVGGDLVSPVTLLDERVSEPDRISTGSRGGDAALVALENAAQAGMPSMIYRIDQLDGDLLDGWIEIDLAPADPSVTTGALEVVAWYAHGGRWVKLAGAADCLW